MPCPDIACYLAAAKKGSLPSLLMRHLEECPPCRERLLELFEKAREAEPGRDPSPPLVRLFIGAIVAGHDQEQKALFGRDRRASAFQERALPPGWN